MKSNELIILSTLKANVIRGVLGSGATYEANPSKSRSIQERSDTFYYPEHRGGYDSYAVASNKRMITFGRPRSLATN